MDGTTFVGLDVHVKTIAIAVIRADGEAQELGIIPNTAVALTKRLKRLGDAATLSVCYEAGPCGYAIYRQLTTLGMRCMVVAPSLIPMRAGDRIKTDRRDARKLARLLRSGDLTAVAPPTPELEAIRDLSRAREAAVGDLRRARQRLLKLLHRRAIAEPAKTRRWGSRWWAWANALSLPLPAEQVTLGFYRSAVVAAQDQVDFLTLALDTAAASGEVSPVIDALQTLHGVGAITALGLVAEIGDFTRFTSPRQLMAYVGLVPSEHSSGSRQQRGHITKTGNTHARRLVIEAAWHYARPLNPKRELAPGDAATARTRLRTRYWSLVAHGKAPQVAIVAVARELLGFIWSVARADSAPTQVAA